MKCKNCGYLEINHTSLGYFYYHRKLVICKQFIPLREDSICNKCWEVDCECKYLIPSEEEVKKKIIDTFDKAFKEKSCGKELCISCNVPKYSKHKENCSQTIRSGMWYFCKGECQSCSNHSHHDQSQQEEPSDDGCKPVDSDFILSEMRNKLRVMKFYNAKGELITDKIMDEINFQDKEFILKLKEGQPLGAKFYVIDKERFDKLSGKFK